MTVRFVSKTLALVAVLALSNIFGSIISAAEQRAGDGGGDANSLPFSNLSASLAKRYPTLRALVLARGSCVFFEYYRKDIGIETQSPVYSVTKSVLSVLVGIAQDEGYLRLDEKLSEVFPEEFDENVDPLAREITLRDLLTKTEGFAEAERVISK
jgi:CubicO group peptidase (beta-lactamase class C family)